MRAPDAQNAGIADSSSGGHRSRAPMGGVRRPFLSRPPHYLGNGLLFDGRRAARPRRILLQARKPQAQKAMPPTRNLFRSDRQLRSNLKILLALSGRKTPVRLAERAKIVLSAAGPAGS